MKYLCMCLAPKSLEHVGVRIRLQRPLVGKNGTPYYERVGTGLMFLSLKSLGVHGLKVMSARDYRYQNCMNVL